MTRRLATLAALSLALTAPAHADAAKRPAKVPANFMGTVADGPLLTYPRVDIPNQLDRMVSNGVQTMRLVFNWGAAQPYESFDQVPEEQRDRYRDENGVPTDYSEIDSIMEVAVERRLDVLPVVQIAPSWAARKAGNFNSPPRDPDEYAA